MAERPGPSERSAYKEFRTLTTRWMDNDPYGHMNNVVHYSLFDTAVNGWLIEQGVLDFVAGEQVGLVVETGCRYFSELAFPDRIAAGLRVREAGRLVGALRDRAVSQRRCEGRRRGLLRACLCRPPDPPSGTARSCPAPRARTAHCRFVTRTEAAPRSNGYTNPITPSQSIQQTAVFLALDGH